MSGLGPSPLIASSSSVPRKVLTSRLFRVKGKCLARLRKVSGVEVREFIDLEAATGREPVQGSLLGPSSHKAGAGSRVADGYRASAPEHGRGWAWPGFHLYSPPAGSVSCGIPLAEKGLTLSGYEPLFRRWRVPDATPHQRCVRAPPFRPNSAGVRVNYVGGGAMNPKRVKLPIVAVVGLLALLLPLASQGDVINFTLTEPSQTGSPGTTLDFLGTLSNPHREHHFFEHRQLDDRRDLSARR